MRICRRSDCNQPAPFYSVFCEQHHAEHLAQFGLAPVVEVDESPGIVTSEVGGGTCHVNGVDFTWRIAETEDFLPLHPIGVRRILVLRITANEGFDLVIRINAHHQERAPHASAWLGPAFALGTATPNRDRPAQVGERFALRPKLCAIPNNHISNAVVERVVQWLRSNRFRPKSCGI